MSKYKSKPIDYSGCNPIIAEHLQRGEAVLCRCPCGEDFITAYLLGQEYLYISLTNAYTWAEPIPTIQRIMPAERAIPVLIAEGWKFDPEGKLWNEGKLWKFGERAVFPRMFQLMGGADRRQHRYSVYLARLYHRGRGGFRVKYFSYDPDGNGFQFHKTAESAKEEAEIGLNAAREEAYEGWSDESMYICWGEIRQQVVVSNSRPATEEDCVDTETWEERNLEDVDE